MKRQVVLLMLLIAALGYAVYSYWPLFSVYLPELGKAAPPEARVAGVKIAEPAEKPALAPGPAPAVRKEEKGAKAEKPVREEKVELIDPFSLRISVLPKSAVKSMEEKKGAKIADEPELEGIWVDSGMRVAFISGQALTEGAVVLGWRVQRITKTEVLLVKGKQKKILRLEAILQ
jgi:hypothetical protein